MPWIIVLLVLLTALIYWFQLRFAAEKQVAIAPGGKEFDVLVHREGVYPQTRSDVFLGLTTVLPALFSVVRNRGRRWSWAVTVRKRTAGVGLGYGPLVTHEVFDDLEVARRRAQLLTQDIAAGTVDWAEADHS